MRNKITKMSTDLYNFKILRSKIVSFENTSKKTEQKYDNLITEKREFSVSDINHLTDTENFVKCFHIIGFNKINKIFYLHCVE